MKRLVVDLAAQALLEELKCRYDDSKDLRRVLTAAIRKLGKLKEITDGLGKRQ